MSLRDNEVASVVNEGVKVIPLVRSSKDDDGSCVSLRDNSGTDVD